MNIARSISGVLSACLLLLASQAVYAGIAGKAQFVSGGVHLIGADGKTRLLHKGELISESDTIATDKEASAQIRMVDGGLIAMRPESQLKIDRFAFSGEQDGSEQGFFSLLKGGMRAITGLVGQLHKASYRINTPNATIGIRGTDHETYVVAPGSALAATVPAGTYNKVNGGGTIVSNAAGAVNVQPNQMGYAGGPNQAPQLQPLNLAIFTATPPVPQGQAAPQGQTSQFPVRASVVVDNAVQGLGTLPASLAAVAATNNVHVPIVGQYQTGGITAPPQTHTIVF